MKVEIMAMIGQMKLHSMNSTTPLKRKMQIFTLARKVIRKKDQIKTMYHLHHQHHMQGLKEHTTFYEEVLVNINKGEWQYLHQQI